MTLSMLVIELRCVACKRGLLDSEVVVKNYRVEKGVAGKVYDANDINVAHRPLH